MVKIKYEHNHSINSADALGYRPVGDEVKRELTVLFAEGHSPSSAYQTYKNQIVEQYGDNYLAVSADRSDMPDYFFVFHFHANYIRQEYDSINGVDNFPRAVANINAYNEDRGKILAKIEQTANGETCVAICDNFNERCHENLPQAGDLVLVDTISNLDRQDTKLFHIMTPSAIGSLPLGTLISTREDEKTMKFGSELCKSLLPENAFFGRSRDMGPKLALTDDANAERNALKHTWPSMILLLCLFHVLQAVWGWLWKAVHNSKFHRPMLFNTISCTQNRTVNILRPWINLTTTKLL